MIEIQKQVLTPTRSSDENHRPTITKWNGESMIRVHSQRAAIKEIVSKSKNRDVLKVGIIGEPHTGKTTQADTIAHLIHTRAKKLFGIDFAVRAYDKDAFVDIRKTLGKLTPANYILKFGDLSFLKSSYGAKKIEELEQAMTEIRHMPGGKDVKIIIVFDYHYSKALPPYLRQSDYNYYTGIGSSEITNMIEMTGKRFIGTVVNFKKISDKAPSSEKFSYKLGNKGFFTYKYRQPFIPMLFWNQDTLRTVVSPTRQWIDPICSICSMSDDTFETELDLDNMIQIGNRNFGPGNFEAAIKLKLHANGINVYGKHIVNASKWIDKIMERKKVNLEDLAVKYNFTPTITKLRKSIDDVV